MPHDEPSTTHPRSQSGNESQPNIELYLSPSYAGPIFPEMRDFLTPEQRLNMLADVLSDIALGMMRKPNKESGKETR